MRKLTLMSCLIVIFALGLSRRVKADSFTYTASTGQTANLDITFSGSNMIVIFRETTPVAASSLSGAEAIATTFGFSPTAMSTLGGFTFVPTSSSVTVASGSTTVGFDQSGADGQGAGFDVSGEWGATVGAFDPGDGFNYHFASANEAHVTQFSGANRDGPVGLNGPQGGVVEDSAARGGLGVVDNGVMLTLALSGTPNATQQTAFFTALQNSANSFVEWGSSAAFGRTGNGGGPPPGIPEPSTVVLLGVGILSLVVVRRRRRK